MNVRIVNKSKHTLPKYETIASAGMDLSANLDQSIELLPLERMLIPTGNRMELPIVYEAQVTPHSGLAAKHGNTLLNTPGTIDADYRGEIKVIRVNLSNSSFTISDVERIAQMIISSHVQAQLEEVEVLSETERGADWGHTGK